MTNAIRLCCTYILSENVPMNTNRMCADMYFKEHGLRLYFYKFKFCGFRMLHS